MHIVLQTCDPHHTYKENDSPIERLRGRLVPIWPEASKEIPNDVDHRNCVDVDTRVTQRPTSGREGFFLEAFYEDAADRDTVRRHECNDTER